MDAEFWRVLANMGFPAVIAGFVLFRLNGKMERLTLSNQELSSSLLRLTDKIEELLRRP